MFAICGLDDFLRCHCFVMLLNSTVLHCSALLCLFLPLFTSCFCLLCSTLPAFLLFYRTHIPVLLSPRVRHGRGSFFQLFFSLFSFPFACPLELREMLAEGKPETASCPLLQSNALAPSRFPAKEHRHPTHYSSTATGITPHPSPTFHSLTPPSTHHPPPPPSPQSLLQRWEGEGQPFAGVVPYSTVSATPAVVCLAALFLLHSSTDFFLSLVARLPYFKFSLGMILASLLTYMGA